MKTKKFIQIMKRYEALYAKEFKDSIALYEVGSSDPYFILPKDAQHISEGSTNLRNIKKTNLATLLDIGDHIVVYLNTPLEDREEEKRYRLRLNVPVMSSKQAWSVYYLNKQKEAKMYRLGSDTASTNWQTIFTESEISQMDITGFEKIEVLE